MQKTRQKGVSPKIVADFLVSVATFGALVLFGVDVNEDPVTLAAIAKAAGFVAGALVGPGKVESA